MGIGKQAKTLSKKQVDIISDYLLSHRNGKRNLVIFLLSVKAGLRAKEIASLTWKMLLTPEGKLSDEITLANDVSKGNPGRIIPMNKNLRQALLNLWDQETTNYRAFDPYKSFVVRTVRRESTTPQAIVNQFQALYKRFGFVGCSSHSGRRTFITNAARKISTVGGNAKDIQVLAGLSSLQTTRRYIKDNQDAQKKVVNLI
ncbi:MAG: site-specific integrase [Chlorobiaceae bacterium]